MIINGYFNCIKGFKQPNYKDKNLKRNFIHFYCHNMLLCLVSFLNLATAQKYLKYPWQMVAVSPSVCPFARNNYNKTENTCCGPRINSKTHKLRAFGRRKKFPTWNNNKCYRKSTKQNRNLNVIYTGPLSSYVCMCFFVVMRFSSSTNLFS